MMKERTTEQLLELYKKKVLHEYPKNDQPEFNLGQLVRVKEDATDINGEFLDFNDRWTHGLISGFDAVREKKRGVIGYVEDISRVALKVRGMKHSNYSFQIRYEDDKSISMDGDWLEKAISPKVEGKDVTPHPPMIPENFKKKRPVELVVGELNHRWDTTNVEIPIETPEDKIEEVAVKQLTKELGSQEVAFITLYHIPPIEE